MGSLQGLAEDLPIVEVLNGFIDYFPPRVGTAVSMLMDLFVGKYAGHSCLLIMRKK